MKLRTGIAFALILIWATACGGKQPPKIEEPEPQAAIQCAGPKKRIAVARFGGTGHYGAFEGWDVGDALATQLATALQHTGCFLVADRAALTEVLREQELGLAGVMHRETAPQAGRLMGAQVIITGDITEFEPGKQGRGLTVGLGFEDIPLGLRLGGNRNKAHLALDLRLIDASTGRILWTDRVESEAKSTGVIVGVDYRQGSVSTDQFSKTPFGQAARSALLDAVGLVIESLQQVDWKAQVIEADGNTIFVNVGADAGIEVGDTFTVSAVQRELIDPATGMSLGRIQRQLGKVRIDSVDERYSVATALGAFEVKRGDYLGH